VTRGRKVGAVVLFLPVLTACTATTSPVQETGTVPGLESQVRQVVEAFGRRLQMVSIQSPGAVDEINEEYSEFVAPTLLESWLSNPFEAPGRLISSPWPDRIEIGSLTAESIDRYAVDGAIVEVTSAEVVAGGGANEVPVHLVLEKIAGRWLIVEYVEER
jgi:hypothetical protein